MVATLDKECEEEEESKGAEHGGDEVPPLQKQRGLFVMEDEILSSGVQEVMRLDLEGRRESTLDGPLDMHCRVVSPPSILPSSLPSARQRSHFQNGVHPQPLTDLVIPCQGVRDEAQVPRGDTREQVCAGVAWD